MNIIQILDDGYADTILMVEEVRKMNGEKKD